MASSPPANHGESNRAVQLGNIPFQQLVRLPLPEPQPDHRHSVINGIVQRHGITPDSNHRGQLKERLPHVLMHQINRIQQEPGLEKILPTGHLLQLVTKALP